MPLQPTLDPLVAALRAIQELLRETQIPAVIVGGVAASLLGRPRMTKDVDLLMWLDDSDWPQFLATAQGRGLTPRISDALGFAHDSRVLLLRHDASQIEVDVTFGAIPFEKAAIHNGGIVLVQGLSLPVPRPEDLVVMKWVAHRPRDLADIEGLLDAHPTLDCESIRETLSSFAEFLPEMDVVGEFDLYLTKRNRRK